MNEKPPVKSYCGGVPNYCTPEVTPEVTPYVDAVNMSQDCVDETAKSKHKWVGLTDQEIENLWNQHESRFDHYSFSCDIEAKLKEKNT